MTTTTPGSAATLLEGRRVRLDRVQPGHREPLQRILRTPEVTRWWGDQEDAAPAWPLDDPETVRFAVTLPADGRVIGLVQYFEETDPMYRHASVDVFLDPAVSGRGLGRDTVAALVHHLIVDRGHHRLTIDPAVDNLPAIRCYAAVGFRPVGRMRAYERDHATGHWHDNLLMDLLAADIDRQADAAHPGDPAGGSTR